MGSVKSQVLLLFDFFAPVKKHGAVPQTKIFVMKLKFYLDSGYQITGRDNRSCKMADSKLHRQFKKMIYRFELY